MVSLVISDTHLGSRHSTLNAEETINDFIEKLGSALQGEHLHEIILLGDIFDLWESTLPDALSSSHAFLKALSETEAGKVVYVPGNHDHHLKVLSSEGDVLANPSQEAYPPLHVKGSKVIRESLSQIFSTNTEIRYPSYEIDISGHPIILTHGHFFDLVQKIPMPLIEAANKVIRGVFGRFYTLGEVEEGIEKSLQREGLHMEVLSLSLGEREQRAFEYIMSDIQRLILSGEEEEVLKVSTLGGPELIKEAHELERYFTWMYEYLYSNTLYGGFSSGERATWDFITWIAGRVGAIYEKIRGRPLTDIADRILGNYKDLLLPERDPEVIVFGHTHKPELERRGGKLFANSGAWLDDEGAFLLIRDEKIELFRYKRESDNTLSLIEHREEAL